MLLTPFRVAVAGLGVLWDVAGPNLPQGSPRCMQAAHS